MKMTIKMNKNGQKVICVKTKNGGFTIQTNGNLPQAHRMGIGTIKDGDGAEIMLEMMKFVNETNDKRKAAIITD